MYNLTDENRNNLVEIYNALNEINVSGRRNVDLLSAVLRSLQMVLDSAKKSDNDGIVIDNTNKEKK